MPSGPLPSNLFDVDYQDIISRVERRSRARIRRGIMAMFSDYAQDSELADIIADLRSGRLSPSVLYRSLDVLMSQADLMSDPVRQALDSSGLSVMRIASRDVGNSLDALSLRSTIPHTRGDVAFDRNDPYLIDEMRQSGGIFWDGLLRETVRAIKDEVERSYFNGDGGSILADRLELVAGLTPDQAESLDRIRKTLAKGPLSPVQREQSLRNTATKMRQTRAERITRTEISRIAHSGAVAYLRQMARKGLLDYNTTMVKWETHADERTCTVCGPLDGVTTVIGGQFSPGVTSPPVHPHCRCSLSVNYSALPTSGISKGFTPHDGDGDGKYSLPGGKDIIPMPVDLPDYTISHRPNEDGPPITDLTAGDLAPSDIYDHPSWYTGFAHEASGKEAIAAIRRMRGKSGDDLVWIYRAGPKGKINNGDWVTPSLSYAREHAMHADDPSKDAPVWAIQVPAKFVRWAGDDLVEWGYFGPSSDAIRKRDGDGDGWENDGKPNMRPAVPKIKLPSIKAHEPEIVHGRSQEQIEEAMKVEEGGTKYAYRVVSEADYQRMKRQGFLNSDGRGNVMANEGLVAAHGRIAWAYLGDIGGDKGADNPTKTGRAIKIRLDDEDGWSVDSDGYIKTKKPVPFDRVEMASMRIGVNRVVERDEGSSTTTTHYDWSAAPLELETHVTAMPEYDGVRPELPNHTADPKYWEWKKRAEAQYGSTVRGNPISPDDKRIGKYVYHVTTGLRSIERDGKIVAGGKGGLGGDDRDRIVSLTIDGAIAIEIAKDMSLIREVAAYRLEGDDLIKHLKKAAEADGLELSDRKWEEIARYDSQGVAAVVNAYLFARDYAGGRRNPLFFGLKDLIERWRENPPSKYDIGIIRIPAKNLKTGAQLTDFDLGSDFLEEVRLYGDLPITGSEVLAGKPLIQGVGWGSPALLRPIGWVEPD